MEVVVTGPGSAPKEIKASTNFTSIKLSWSPPDVVNSPLKATEILYTRDGNETLGDWESVKVEGELTEVILESLEPESDYYIQLRAVDDLGPGVASDIYRVQTGAAIQGPHIAIEPSQRVEVKPGEGVKVVCRVLKGVPVPLLSWHHKGAPIRPPKAGRSATLSPTALFEDSQLECHAENVQGSDVKTLNIIVMGPGSAPDNIQNRVLEGVMADISWGRPVIPNGAITGYTLDYRPADEDKWKRVEMDGSTYSAQLPQLLPNTDYHFRMRAVSERGPGIWTKNIGFKTGIRSKSPTHFPSSGKYKRRRLFEIWLRKCR